MEPKRVAPQCLRLASRGASETSFRAIEEILAALSNLSFRVELVSGTALAAGFSAPVASAIPLTNPNFCL